MQLRTRIGGGGTRPLDSWGVDSEYGTLRDVLIGPIDHFTWQPGNAVCEQKPHRRLAEGLTVYDPEVSMIGNGGGAVHCMCQALRRDHVRIS